MTLRLEFITETGAARRYRTAAGREFWIPRSCVTRTLKFSNGVHEIDLEDWKAKDLGLLDSGPQEAPRPSHFGPRTSP
jgi:hypothetical protein